MPDMRESRFDWPLCYEAENLVLDQIAPFCARNSAAGQMAERMRTETGTLLIDWVDHLVLPAVLEPALRKAGFTPDPLAEGAAEGVVFWHPDAMLPRVIVDRTIQAFPSVLTIRVDSISDFMAANHLSGEPEGQPFTRFRRIPVSFESGTRFEAVERNGYRGYATELPRPTQPGIWGEGERLWRTRGRYFDDDTDGFRQTLSLVECLVAMVGRDVACHIVFAEARAFWEQRNRAARIQKQRQDGLGLGWANHDHHTFRSSRRHFLDLMSALEKLGFERRERYYAGAQAGWGAQILEQPVEGIVAFCDVDLDPAETQIDFSRQGLSTPTHLGTIGLWVGLHGESFLQAGMHHLECRFDFSLLRDQLAAEGVSTMKPFSDFSFLKQAFTEGEQWPVRRERAERLLREGFIDDAQFRKFMSEGAIGSHLENLQRKGGFKGFNQSSVSAIIRETDPRSQSHAA